MWESWSVCCGGRKRGQANARETAKPASHRPLLSLLFFLGKRGFHYLGCAFRLERGALLVLEPRHKTVLWWLWLSLGVEDPGQRVKHLHRRITAAQTGNTVRGKGARGVGKGGLGEFRACEPGRAKDTEKKR